MVPEHLHVTIKLLPDKPGIYKYFDEGNTIIYIGKAKSLKKRVLSYFNKNVADNYKTKVLVTKIASIDFTVVDTEMDALLLENSLIKEFQPKYNINLKDDKSYPLIKITNERFPQVYPMRNPIKDGSEYFGPYASPRIMHTVLDLIKKIYPTRNCSLKLTEKNIADKKFKVCLEYQIGNCKGPCEGLQTEEDYLESIKNIKHLLRGNLSEVRINLKKDMQQAAQDLKFEQAQQFKEKIEMLDVYRHKSTVVNPTSVGNVEVFGISSTEKIAFVNYLRVTNGLIISSQNLEFRKKLDESESDVLEMAIGELHYNHEDYTEFVLPFNIEAAFEGISITVPKAGDKKKLLELSLKNALYFKKEKLDQYEKLNPDVRVERLMEQMRNDLRLTEQPRHIECFDNSNFQGSYPVSACVVFKDGKPAKSEYRIFNVKTVEGPNDFATMTEVVSRRYARIVEENKPLPQLIIIDGGKGQLSAAVDALKSLNLYGKMAIMGIAKRLEEIYYPGDSLPLYIDKKSETLKIIQQLRDEAHRFGITNHRKRRDKGTLQTELTEIKGLGQNTAEKLLGHFKSIKSIKSADLEELKSVIGNAKATLVHEYYSKIENE